MLHIDFIDTETGKHVFEEGQIIEAQNSVIDNIQMRFGNLTENKLQIIKWIGSLDILSQLRQYSVTCQSKDDFIHLLTQNVPQKNGESNPKN